jgi:hypothetical protein
MLWILPPGTHFYIFGNESDSDVGLFRLDTTLNGRMRHTLVGDQR